MLNKDSRPLYFSPISIVRKCALAAALLVGSLGAPGCIGFINVVPNRYVYSKGSSNDITAWILKQQDFEQVSNGMSVLANIAGGMRDSEKERNDALTGYVKVHRKLENGWPPGIDQNQPLGEKTLSGNSRWREGQIEADYIFLIQNGTNRVHFSQSVIPPIRKTFYLIRPLPTETSRLQLWEKCRALTDWPDNDEINNGADKAD